MFNLYSVEVTSLMTFTFSVCVFLDGQLFTWGQNTNGQLGLGKGEPSKLSPYPLKSLAGVPLAQITAGGDHSFALSLSGAVFGWGKNRAGQLGLNDKQGINHLIRNYVNPSYTNRFETGFSVKE